MRQIGAHWEDAALAHLQQSGLKLLDRNFNCRYGELDLVARDRDTIVFVEVRYRASSSRGDGAESIGASKRAKLVRAAQVYLQTRPQFASSPCRFDVVACGGTPQQPQIDWMRNAFEAF
jgi:putative endonuclease